MTHTPTTPANPAQGVSEVLREALNFVNEASGAALGIAMSGSDHPNPDEVLMDLSRKGMDLAPRLTAAIGAAPKNDASASIAEMRQTAKELRENANGDCNAARQAIYWDGKADALEAAIGAGGQAVEPFDDKWLGDGDSVHLTGQAVDAPVAAFDPNSPVRNVALSREPDHPDDLAVDRFAAAMKAKLAKKRDEGRGGWDNPDECSAAYLSLLLVGHIEKGDPLDVGNLAMMLHQRGDRISDESERYAERVKQKNGGGYPADTDAPLAANPAQGLTDAMVDEDAPDVDDLLAKIARLETVIAGLNKQLNERFDAPAVRDGISAHNADFPAWVLEHADSPTNAPRYWAAGQIDPLRSSAWTENHMAAIRFAREEDAAAVRYRLMKKAGVDVRVCEHIWSAAIGAGGQAVAVKPLEWVSPSNGRDTLVRCETNIGVYRVWTHLEADGQWWWSLDGYQKQSGEASACDEAKSAAQADYERRILSALAHPAKSGWREPDKWRSKLNLWFFRDLSDEQRLKLFSLFELPVDEIGTVHSHQRKALDRCLPFAPQPKGE